ncbi:DNA (cytosine-5)-methyltransferase DRM1 isoform X4 [Cryptomeria japonica]|uniref:DNA (cytosine-5)-methyltransferase DRM1 isoform X4 n=1 Tax=Cryptomeria japonica TaxID=3369 RepID=UPI0025AC22D4|nr:DNA (cytosine-5)-methyltransferase DRM1 isoform X4 [Cryptomeria japonica]
MASLVDYEDSDEETSPPVACITEERDRPNNICSEVCLGSAWVRPGSAQVCPGRNHPYGSQTLSEPQADRIRTTNLDRADLVPGAQGANLASKLFKFFLVTNQKSLYWYGIQCFNSGRGNSRSSANENAILEYIRNNQECSSDSDWCLIKRHFVSMGFSSTTVDKALEECGTEDEALILEFLTNFKGSSCESSSSSTRKHFMSMGFSSDIVDKAIEERGTEDEALILDFLTNYKGSSCESSSSSIRKHFMLMGFSSDIVDKAIEERGIEDEAEIFESILTYELMLKKELLKKSSSHNEDFLTQSESSVSEVTDTDDEDIGQFNEEINLKTRLLEMGYAGEEVSLAVKRYGVDIPIDILIDSIDAVRHSEATSYGDMGDPYNSLHSEATSDGEMGDPYNSLTLKKKGLNESLKNTRQIKFPKRKHIDLEEDCYETNRRVKLKGSMSSGLVGFGVPGHHVDRCRKLKDFSQGPPYFYFENVYITPKGVWEEISRFFHNIEPEFVDSKFFSVSSRKRGYVHNLPIDNRVQLYPLPPMTIKEAFPEKQKFWPSWDERTKLNCINTVAASAPLCLRLRDIVNLCNGQPTPEERDMVLLQCKKWNLVWANPDQLAPLEPHDMELVLGYDKDHTRVCGRTERIRSLGNAFQVETVGYHLSVLKPLYPKGIKVLSLFSGIGGAEVALHRLGIPLNYVVSAEICKVNRLILRSWWEKTHQKGKLIEVGDVKNLTKERLDEMINSIGGFDLIIGGSPCNNLTGSNRCTRHGLAGEQSSLFYEFPRIVKYVRGAMRSKLT